MKGNLLLFVSLLAGILVGMSGATPQWLLNPQLPMLLLELLIVQVGMGIGSMEHLDRLFAGFRWEMLLPCGGQWLWLLLALVGAHQPSQGRCRRFCCCQPTGHDSAAGQYRARDGVAARLSFRRSQRQRMGSDQCGGHLVHGRLPAFHFEQYGQQTLYAYRHLPWSLSGGQCPDACYFLL